MLKYNLFVTYATAMDLEWQLWEIAEFVTFAIPAAIYLATLDSLRIGRRAKLAFLCVAEARIIHLYVDNRYLTNHWGDNTMCVRPESLFSAKLIYLSTSAQVGVVVLKSILALSKGLPFG